MVRLFRPRYATEDDADGSSPYRFRSRTITLSELEEVKEDFEQVCDRVEICRTSDNESIGVPVVNLNAAANHVYQGLVVAGYLDRWPGSPILSLRVGRRLRPELTCVRHIVVECYDEQLAERVDAAYWRAIERVRACPRRLASWEWRAVAQVALWAVLAALLIWFLTAAWPSVPLMLVGVLAVLCTEHLSRPALERRFGDGNEAIVVRAVTRQAARDQRWNNRRDIRVGLWTAVATAVGTVAASTQSWWPF